MQTLPEMPLDENLNPVMVSPNITPIYSKCLACPDYGTTCRGFDLVSLGDIGAVRAFHRAMKKARNISLKAIAAAAPIISESTINEYFSNVAKDYKWTTVVAIDNAFLSICGNRIGLPPLDHSCPAAASEFRNQLAAADLKVAAAELKAAQHETDTLALQQKLTDTKAKHISQITLLESSHAKDMEWMKNEVKLWRRFSFVLLITGLVLLAGLVFYIGWDAAHPASGLIRY